jgi:hypothetical protein
MTPPRVIALGPAEASGRIQKELEKARDALHTGDLDAALDGYIRALGLALQLGPVPTEQVLGAILGAAQELTDQPHAGGLAVLGPALVDLVTQVRSAGALPPTSVMEAWATVTSDLGALVGQVGLALMIAPDHRVGMMKNARTRAALLDDATGNVFALASWLDRVYPSP